MSFSGWKISFVGMLLPGEKSVRSHSGAFPTFPTRNPGYFLMTGILPFHIGKNDLRAKLSKTPDPASPAAPTLKGRTCLERVTRFRSKCLAHAAFIYRFIAHFRGIRANMHKQNFGAVNYEISGFLELQSVSDPKGKEPLLSKIVLYFRDSTWSG